MKILFISRAYPPTLGGIENQNAGIAKHLGEIAEVTVLANTRGKKFLPLFLPYIFFKSLFLTARHDVALLGDGVLSPIGAILSIVYPKKKFASIIHGLDITYAQKKSLMGKIYRCINIPSLKLLDKLIMVGNVTIERAVEAGLDRKRCVFIPNGIDPEDICEEHTREELENLLNRHREQCPESVFAFSGSPKRSTPDSEIAASSKTQTRNDLKEKIVILRIGRYVKHKGALWFIRNVVPKLPEHVMFVAAGAVVNKKTAGDEDYFPRCKRAIKELQLEGRVKLLTNLKWEEMKILFNTVDIVVSPNIPVPGSMEGFGINAIEAAVCGRAVVASDFEGLKDAIKQERNGLLVEPKNPDAWVGTLSALIEDTTKRKDLGKRAREYTLEHYTWDKIAKKYLQTLGENK